MNKHHEIAEGLFNEINVETENFVFNQTMLRIKNPKQRLLLMSKLCLIGTKNHSKGKKKYENSDFSNSGL